MQSGSMALKTLNPLLNDSTLVGDIIPSMDVYFLVPYICHLVITLQAILVGTYSCVSC